MGDVTATLDMYGRATTYRLLDDTLTLGERTIPLADIARVRLAKLGAVFMCELTLRDGKSTTLANDDRDKLASYGELMRALHAKLARHDVQYVRGAWLLVSVIGSIGLIAILLAIALWQQWIVPPATLRVRATLVMLVGIAWTLVGPLLVWRTRPHPYDPSALPKDLVPS